MLNTCSRHGLFNRIKLNVEAMTEAYCMAPILEHHASIVSILRKNVGRLGNAVTMIQKYANL